MPIFPSFKYIKPIIGKKKVLDVGCGVGRYLEHFSRDSIGIEYSSASIEVCLRKKLNVIKSDVNEKLPFKDNQFEIVFASHVIEHLESPFNFLQEANRVLKDRGIVILGFPVEKSLTRILGDHYFNEHPGHLYSFSIEGIKRLLEKNSFRPEKVFVDISLIGRLPALSPILYLANKLPLSFTLWWANAVWMVAKKINRSTL